MVKTPETKNLLTQIRNKLEELGFSCRKSYCEKDGWTIKFDGGEVLVEWENEIAADDVVFRPKHFDNNDESKLIDYLEIYSIEGIIYRRGRNKGITKEIRLAPFGAKLVFRKRFNYDEFEKFIDRVLSREIAVTIHVEVALY